MVQIAEVQAGATGAATTFPVVLASSTTGQYLPGQTEAGVEIAYCREGESAWTVLDDANADNILAEQGRGRYTQRTIAAPMAQAAGVGYVDFHFSGPGILDQIVRVFLRPYDWRSAPATESGIATAVTNALLLASDERGHGAQSQPAGGSTVAVPVRNSAGTIIRTRSAFYDSTGRFAGITPAVPV